MSTLTTEQHYDVPGGTLKVILTTDHALTPAEREELDHVTDACRTFQEHQRSGHPHRTPVGRDPAGDLDEAIRELGGEQAISAGWPAQAHPDARPRRRFGAGSANVCIMAPCGPP